MTYKDRLSRVGYDLFYYLFQKYNCEIVVMSEVGSEEVDSQEIFSECRCLEFQTEALVESESKVHILDSLPGCSLQEIVYH